jgi:hypothetical protein
VKFVHSCVNVGFIRAEQNDNFPSYLYGTYTEFSLLEIGFSVVSTFAKGREHHQLKHYQLIKTPLQCVSIQDYFRQCRNVELLTHCMCDEGSIPHFTRGYRALPLAYVLYNMAPVAGSSQGH